MSGGSGEFGDEWRDDGGGMGRLNNCRAVLTGHARVVRCLALGVESRSSNSIGSNITRSCDANFLVYNRSLETFVKLWRVSDQLTNT